MAQAAAAPSLGDFPNYQKDLDKCITFLQEYKDELKTSSIGAENSADHLVEGGQLKYLELIHEVVKKTQIKIDIELDDIVRHGDSTFADEISRNTMRYVQLFSKAIDQLVDEDPANKEALESFDNDDIGDVLRYHRVQMIQQAHAADAAEQQAVGGIPQPDNHKAKIKESLPPALLRRYEVRIKPKAADESAAVALRNVKAEDLGKLVTIRCIVLRASDVRPSIQVAAYTCDTCGFEIYQEVTSRTFMPVPKCISEQCVKNQSPGKVNMITRGCKFVKYQEIKVQELPEQVPVGHIPRAMTVIARGEITRRLVAGDIVTIGGVYLPTPYTGYQAIKAGLTTDAYLEAQCMAKVKKQEALIGEDGQESIKALKDDPDLYEKMSKSIAPEIFGHEDVKKALLLQLVGGMTTQQKDGMRTRGDLHICMMGDPGVAKSQLLKYISRLAPRCVYTTGKGSSGVGLTAAVVRDPMTQELTLEGGALVLADMGICCIDEFDKMEESDRTAIHEVMEQQTVSIAKAGITTMLNARTSVLAAANPKYGRYNRSADKDPHVALLKNINLPAALLSRFDLIFLLLDEVDSSNDRALAEHVTYVHKNEEHPPLAFEPLQPALIRSYLAVAKHIPCHVPAKLSSYIVEAYVDIRERDKLKSEKSGGRGTITARQLQAILRLAQARARLHFRQEVEIGDVNEAIRLVNMSKASVDEPVGGSGEGGRGDFKSRVYNMMTKMMKDNKGSALYNDLRNEVTQRGYTDVQFNMVIEEYLNLNIWQINPSWTRLTLTGSEAVVPA